MLKWQETASSLNHDRHGREGDAGRNGMPRTHRRPRRVAWRGVAGMHARSGGAGASRAGGSEGLMLRARVRVMVTVMMMMIPVVEAELHGIEKGDEMGWMGG